MITNTRGFTLVEVMLVSALLVAITGAVLTVFYQSNASFASQNELARTTQQQRLALDQMVRLLRQAGSDPANALTVPPVEILGPEHIRINTDITGSVPSTTADPKESTGDPDGLQNSIFERVIVRYDGASDSIFIDIGYGEELLADRVEGLTFTFFDLSGNITTDPAQIARARVELTALTPNVDLRSGKVSSVSLASDVFIRSRTEEIFR